MKKILMAAVFALGCMSAQAQNYVTIPDDVNALLVKYTCNTCHKAEGRSVGPTFVDIAARKYKAKQIVGLIAKPKPENWPGYVPMTAMPQVPKEDAMKIANWIVTLGKKK